MDKACDVCGKSIEGKDPRKKYCSNACKQDAHRQRHGLAKPVFLTADTNKLPEAIKTIQTVSPKSTAVSDRVEADDRFLTVSQAIVELNSKIYRLQFQKEGLLSRIAPLETHRSALGDMANGLKQGNELGQQWKENSGNEAVVKLGLALGVLSAFNSIQSTDHDTINRKNRLKARVLRAELREIDEQLNELTAKRIYLETGLNQLKREIKSELIATPVLPAPIYRELANVTQLSATPALIVPREDARVISLSQLKAQEFDVYEFSSGFEDIIGNPAKNFSMVVYGESGQGKSTWVMDFANYLAEHHGRVLYNSSEERISASLKRKLLKYDSDNFAISECQTYKALKQAIRGNSFKFVVIDSINDMNIKPNQLVELTELNADKAFIYIMQATKQGNYKGSTQFVHDADILIKLERYQPIVEKTRYK